MTESIGTARLDIVVDTSNFDAGVTKAKRSTQDLTKAAQQAAQAQQTSSSAGVSASARQVAALERQIATLGKSRDEVIKWRIEQQTSGKVAEQLTQKLNAQVASLRKGGVELNQYGVSAKQTAAALRGVPAQITDIVTSLQGGQRPLTVLLQQGGQLKDMFGGIVPAARALGSQILALVNPYTLAAAAIAGVGIAWHAAAERAADFNRALIVSGNYAQTTAEALDEMAASLDATTNATKGKAVDVLAQVASTGRFTAEQLDTVARAAIQMEDVAGQAIEDTIAQFVSLKDDPVAAILKLNQAQNFLTQETLDQIVSLQKQGREAEATSLAIQTMADTIDVRAPQMVGQIGLMESAWRGVKKGAKDALDGIVTGFQEADKSAKESLDTIGQWLSAIKQGPFGVLALQSAQTFAPSIAAASSPRSTVDTATAKAALEFEKEAFRFATDKQRMERDITEARALGLKAGKSQLEIEKRISDIRASYARKAPKTGAGLERAENRSALQVFQDQLKKEQGAIANSTQLLQAQYSARLVTVEHYYSEQKRLAQQGQKAEETAILGQIGVLKARKVTGKDGIDTARELATLEAELAKVRADSSTKLAILNIQEQDTLKQRRLAAEAYKSALDQNTSALQEQMDTMVARIGMGEREFEIQSKVNDIYREQAKELLELARQRDAGQIDQEAFDKRLQQLKSATDEQVQIVRDGYDRMAQAQTDWANGATKAYQDIRDEAADVAGFTYDIFRDAFNGLADVITDFVTGSKSNWKDMLDDLGRQITNFIVKQQLSKLAGKLFPGAGGGDEASALSGSASKLAASAGPLLGAASALSAAAAQLAAAGAANGATGAASSGGGFWAGLVNAVWGSGGPGYANGGAFANGSEIAFATGGIVSSPTRFPMSGGRIGLMGEAGPEAIMPLVRGSDNKLGVRVQGGGNTQNNSIEQNVYVQGRVDGTTLGQMARKTGREAAREIARTGR